MLLHREQERRIEELKATLDTRSAIQLADQESRAAHDSVFFGNVKVEAYIVCPCCGKRVAVELVAGQVVARKE